VKARTAERLDTFLIQPKRSFWQHALALTALIVLVGALSKPSLRGPIDLRYDAGVYYVLGTSLAHGDGYRLTNEPGAIQAVQYPPLLPAFVAAHQMLLGSDDPAVAGRALRWSFHGLYLAFVLAAYWLVQKRHGPWLAFFAAACTALNLFAWYLADLCFTEIPFACVTMLFLLAHAAQRRWSTAVCGVLGAAAFLLRTAGVALFAAWIAEALFQRRFKAALVRCALAVAPIAAWQAHVMHVRASSEYSHPTYSYQRAPWQYYNVTYGENLALVDPFRPELGALNTGAALARFGVNLLDVPFELGEAVSATRQAWEWPIIDWRVELGYGGERQHWIWVAPFVIGCVVLLGLYTMVRGGERMEALYVTASAAMISATPWPAQSARYLMPLTPLIAIAFVHGTTTVAGWIGAFRRARALASPRRLLLAAAILIAFTQIYTAVATHRTAHEYVLQRDRYGRGVVGRYFYFDDSWRELEGAVDWIAANTDPQSIIASTTPHLVYLRTGRKAIMPPFEIDPTLCSEMLDSVPVDYVIVDALQFVDSARRYAAPVVETRTDRWSVAYTSASGGLRIYRRSPS
jgi:hypothetical protein